MDNVLRVDDTTLGEKIDLLGVSIQRVIQEKADAEKNLIARARRLGEFYGQVWHSDPRHYDGLLRLLERGVDVHVSAARGDA